MELGMGLGMVNGNREWEWEIGIERYPVPGDDSIILGGSVKDLIILR